MARLREDMVINISYLMWFYVVCSITNIFCYQKKNSADPSSVSRVKVWIKAHTKKDGSAINTKVSETIVSRTSYIVAFI